MHAYIACVLCVSAVRRFHTAFAHGQTICLDDGGAARVPGIEFSKSEVDIKLKKLPCPDEFRVRCLFQPEITERQHDF
jgi:hypothetical protein